MVNSGYKFTKFTAYPENPDGERIAPGIGSSCFGPRCMGQMGQQTAYIQGSSSLVGPCYDNNIQTNESSAEPAAFVAGRLEYLTGWQPEIVVGRLQNPAGMIPRELAEPPTVGHIRVFLLGESCPLFEYQHFESIF